jgi:hypothetical protein
METIARQELWTFCDGKARAQKVGKRDFRKAPAHYVRSFLELATKVAELQFRNRDYVLMFRGQNRDHRNLQKLTTLKPTLFRPIPGKVVPPGGGVLLKRFDLLKSAEARLVRNYVAADFLGVGRLKRYQTLRWAILQHYEVCPTPLLDVTQSLRIAASFASATNTHEAFVFVVGVPNVSGAITASAEAGVQIIRLASVCPPAAVRPHLQEGYLLGEYPEMSAYNQKELYKAFEIDFGRRLVAKFRFNPKQFWRRSASFPKVGLRALYPSRSKDPLYAVCAAVKQEMTRFERAERKLRGFDRW